jgi:SAM-dependent methyltransferase
MRNIPVLSGIYRKYKRRRLERRLSNRPAEAVFTEIFARKRWAGADSVSGPGSDHLQTDVIVRALPALFKELNVTSILDIPCGDLYWMNQVDMAGVRYIGADIVREIVERNRTEHERESVRFMHLDIIKDDLPKVDLILCRDCLVHFSFENIFSALENIRRSGSAYLLATTFTGWAVNHDIMTGEWRPLNLTAPPINLPPPIHTINEGCTQDDGSYGDKSLGLWRIGEIRPRP